MIEGLDSGASDLALHFCAQIALPSVNKDYLPFPNSSVVSSSKQWVLLVSILDIA